MRQLLSSAVLGALVCAGYGCGPPAEATRPEPRGEFRVLLPARPSTLNPDLTLDEVALVIGRSLFNHILSLDESGRLLPELATSWGVSADGLTYTFRLREGVRWHDGAPFSSADVQWTLDTLAKNGFGGGDALAPVQAIATPDPLTVVVTLHTPWAPFAADLAGPGLSILPKHIYAGRDWRTHPANDRPVGTGPFKFGRWADARTLVLEANEQYFRSGPYVNRLIFEVTPPDAIAAKLIAGEADYSLIRPVGLRLDALPDHLVAHILPTSGRTYLAFNLRRRPFSDVRVRRALASAIDRLALIREGLSGLGAPAVGWYTPDVEWAYNAAARVPDYDRARAGQLLDAAGLRLAHGERLRASLVVADTPPVREVGDFIRAQLAAIGVTLIVERISLADWPKRVLTARDFDLTVLSGGQGPDPDQLRKRFLAGTDTSSYLGYDDPDFRDAVEHGARVVDLGERAAAYYRAQEVLARDVPFVPLAESVRLIVHNRRVSGLPQLEARGLVGSLDFSLVKLAPGRPPTAR